MSRRNVGGESDETKKRDELTTTIPGDREEQGATGKEVDGDVVVVERGADEGEKRGDLATTTPGTVTNKGLLARRSMGRCSCR
jgi:hypothetical protein